MLRKLLATTAISSLMATGAMMSGAHAQATTQPAPAAEAAPADAGRMVEPAAGHLASNIIGETVFNGPGDDAQNIGKVNDLVIGADGQVNSIIVGVGGFLGLGEKNVEVAYDSLNWAEKDGDRWIVISATADQLKELPSFDPAPYEPGATTAASDATPMAAPVAAPAVADDATPPAAAAPTDQQSTAAVDRSTLTPLDSAQIKADEFVGTTVYGANEENVGSIGDVILADGAVDAVVIDVGGFLGMGQKPVAVSLDNLAFMTGEDGKRYLYTDFTKDQLEAAPAFDKDSFAENRNEMLITVPN